MVISLTNELSQILSVGVPEGENVVDISFPNERFEYASAKDLYWQMQLLF